MKINTNPLSACCVFLIYLTVSLTYAEPIKIKPSTPLKANSLTKEADTSPQLNCAYLNKDSKQDSQSNSVGVLNFNISTKFNSKEKDLKVAKEIYKRSAKLVATSLAGLIDLLAMHDKKIKKVRITAEGSLFWSSVSGCKDYNKIVKNTLKELLAEMGHKKIKVNIAEIESANMIGSGIAALS